MTSNKCFKKITFMIPSLGMGGAERVVSVLANEMISRDIEVIIFILDKNDIYYSLNEKIKVVFVDYDYCENRVSRNYKRIMKIRKLLRKYESDLIISFITSANFLAILSSLFTRRKVIVSERSNPKRFDSNKKVKFLRNFLYLFANGAVFQTTDAQRCFSNRIIKKSTVIANPVAENLPKWESSTNRKKEIITACRLEESKNLPLLILAFKEFSSLFPDYKLIIYGDGPAKDNLRELIVCEKLNQIVILAGRKKDWHKNAVDSMIFVISSNFEGMSNSLIEALSMGIPTISTDHPMGGASSLINHKKNGLLIPVNDINQLFNSLCLLADDFQLRNKLSRNAMRVNDSLSVKSITDKWIEYSKIIKAGS